MPRHLALWTALCLLPTGAGCGGQDGPSPAARSGPPPRAVEVAPARRTTHARALTLSGTLAPLEQVQVAARVEGPITEVRVDLGDHVARDQVLAAIRPVDYRARVSELEAGVAQAQNDVQRARDLGRAGTAEELEIARTRLAQARAQRAQASRQLGDTTVRAPFAGAIAARHVAPGTYVKSGTPLFDLVAVERLRLTLEVPERHAAAVGVGTRVQLRPHEQLRPGAEAPEALSAGTGAVEVAITRVSPVVSPSTRTFTVEAVFSPAGSALKPGMYISAELALGEATESVRVPRPAVFHVLGRDRVMTVVDGVARPQDVELLGEADGEAIVLGLAPDTQVIVRGPALVAPGAAVAPEPARPAELAAGERAAS